MRPLQNKGTCRICLKANRGRQNVSFEVSSEWSKLLMFCFGIEVDGDKGPRVLCRLCSDKLKEFSDFKTLAIKSDNFWKNVLASNTVKTELQTKESIKITKTEPVKTENNKTATFKLPEESIEIIPKKIAPKKDDGFDYFKLLSFEDSTQIVHSDDEDKEIYYEVEALDDETDYDDIDYDDTLQSAKDIPEPNHKRTRRTIDDEYKPVNFENDSEMSFSNEMNEIEGITKEQLINKYFVIGKYRKGNIKRIKYQCRNCCDDLKSALGIPKHVRNCFGEDISFENTIEGKKKENVLPKPEVFYCGVCEFSSRRENEVTAHFKKHITKNDLNCELCDFAGQDMSEMIIHRYKHMPTDFNYKMFCPICKKSAKKPMRLQFHYRAVHLKKPGGCCSYCELTYRSYVKFRQHMRIHTESKPRYICDFCEEKFWHRDKIIYHLRIHMDMATIVCEACGAKFCKNSDFLTHTKIYHTEHKAVDCDHCGKTFKNQDRLDHHMKKISRGLNYICEVCQKGFGNSTELKSHVVFHYDVRPYPCEYCEKRFKTKSNLVGHVRIHTGICKHKCDDCGKQFATSSQLKIHKSVHTGVRRHKCLVCERTFHDRKLMAKHCQAKHKSVTIVEVNNRYTLLTPDLVDRLEAE